MKETLIKQLFFQTPVRFRMLLIFPILNLLVLSIVLLFLKAPKEAILLSMASISYVVFCLGTRRFVSLFYISSLVFNVMVLFVTWSQDSIWSRGWGLSMILTLTIGYYLSAEVLEYFQGKEKNARELDKEKNLWKNRFETLRDAHNLEIVALEEDVELKTNALETANKQMSALQKLVEVTHKEATMLSKQRHELSEKIKGFSDERGNDDIVKENQYLHSEVDKIAVLNKQILSLDEENKAILEKASKIEEKNRVLIASDKSLENSRIKDELEKYKQELQELNGAKGYSKEQIMKILKTLVALSKDKTVSKKVIAELEEKLLSLDKPFKWHVWNGDKKEKKVALKNKISMTDLGKGLKI